MTALSACGREKSVASAKMAARAATLVLYDDTTTPGWSELNGLQLGQLASHFGPWTVKPIRQYQQGDAGRAAAVIYSGGQDVTGALPDSLLDDVLAGKTPVLWLLGNVDGLVARASGFSTQFGFEPGPYESRGPVAVDYKGTRLPRDSRDTSMVRGAALVDASKAEVLAWGIRSDGSRFPWAIRSGMLTYVGEVPFSYVADGDRSLAVADFLFDLLAPAAPERHRALVRIEDVSPVIPASNLRALADALSSLEAPFAVAVIPVFEDPLGHWRGDGKPLEVRMHDAPDFVAALRYMVDRGGTLVMHGYTHQYSNVVNPYDAVSGDDFEFWRAQVGSDGGVQFDGPIPEDSESWAADRIRQGMTEFALSGLPAAEIWEFPHYAASAADSRAIQRIIPQAYQRGFYFAGLLAGTPDPATSLNQAFPFDVTDVYGFRTVPENLGFYSPTLEDGVPRNVSDMVTHAHHNKVVRDGFASFFFHPLRDPRVLVQIVNGIQGEGYTFVPAGDVLLGSRSGAMLPSTFTFEADRRVTTR